MIVARSGLLRPSRIGGIEIVDLGLPQRIGEKLAEVRGALLARGTEVGICGARPYRFRMTHENYHRRPGPRAEPIDTGSRGEQHDERQPQRGEQRPPSQSA